MDDELPTPVRRPPDSKSPPIPAAPVVVGVQVLALAGLIVYAMTGLVLNEPLDARVLAALVAFGVGLRPSTIGDILRRMLGVETQK